MKKLICIAIIAITVLQYSCRKDFIVKDIKNDTITIIGPANNLVTTTNLVTFWWEELDGAEKYNLQVVQPSFAAMTKVLLDTNVTTNKYNLTLQPGSYQWRIRGVNAGGNTVYQVFNLKVDTTSNLSSQVVYPIAPINGYLTGNAAILFSWSALNAATYYQFEINNGSVLTATTTGTSYSYTLPAVTNSTSPFTWRVKAFNNFSVSQYNSPFTFTVDLAPPSAPLLTSPIHGSTVKDTVKLVWTRTGAPDALSDSIFVSTDSLFANVISKTRTWQQKLKINQLVNPPNINNAIYWWRLRSIDSVGNRSGYSNQLKFKLSYP
jgi:hypothetical protein